MWDYSYNKYTYNLRKYTQYISHYLTWEVVLFLFFIGILLYVHFKFARKDEVYTFRGLTDE